MILSHHRVDIVMHRGVNIVISCDNADIVSRTFYPDIEQITASASYMVIATTDHTFLSD